MPITHCPNCTQLFEARSEEAANDPARRCPDCAPSMLHVREIEQEAEAAAERGDMERHDVLMARRRYLLRQIESNA